MKKGISDQGISRIAKEYKIGEDDKKDKPDFLKKKEDDKDKDDEKKNDKTAQTMQMAPGAYTEEEQDRMDDMDSDDYEEDSFSIVWDAIVAAGAEIIRSIPDEDKQLVFEDLFADATGLVQEIADKSEQ